MANYDYKAAVKNDVIEWIADDDGFRFSPEEFLDIPYEDRAAVMASRLFYLLCECDRVTGYAEGYDWESVLEGYLEGNDGLLQEAADALLVDLQYVNTAAGKDYTIRRYVLKDALAEIAAEMNDYIRDNYKD